MSILVGVFAVATTARAAPLTQVEVRFDRMKINTPTTGTVCAKPTTVGTEAQVKVTFPAGYTVSTVLANWTVSTDNLAWPTGGTIWPGILTATAASDATKEVTFPSGELAVGTLYCFNWTSTSALTTKTTATNSNTGIVTTQTNVPATIDSSTFATATIADDQIVVTASVAETFSFALVGTNDTMGAIPTNAVRSSPSPSVATINTNAKNGWSAWAKDLNTGLNSASASKTIASTTPGTNSTLNAGGGTEGYNTGVVSSQVGGLGTVTVATPFVGGSSGRGGGLNTALQTIATSNGTAQDSSLTLTNNATISTITPAASDYRDVITIVAAGLF